MKLLEAKQTRHRVRCSTASGDLRWMVAQHSHDAQAEGSGQGRRRWKPSFVIAALPLAMLFAYGFVRFMLELVFPIATRRSESWRGIGSSIVLLMRAGVWRFELVDLIARYEEAYGKYLGTSLILSVYRTQAWQLRAALMPPRLSPVLLVSARA